jgi:hypothetical protein
VRDPTDPIFYTYAWLREDRTPYYIGKGHGQRAYRKGAPSTERVLILKKGLTEPEALKHEVYLIFVLGRKDKNPEGILINLTDGGEGTVGIIRSEEWSRWRSTFMTENNPMSGVSRPEHSAKMSGDNNPMKLKENKLKIRQARLNEKVACPHCGKVNNKGNHAQHVPACKLNPANLNGSTYLQSN